VQKKAVLVAQLFLLVFCVIGLCLLIANLMLKKSFREISKAVVIAKDRDSQEHLKLEQNLRKDIEEKYRADMVSYRVVAKRLEQEKEKQKNLELKTVKPGIKTKGLKGGVR